MTNKEVTQVSSKREPVGTHKKVGRAARLKFTSYGDVVLKPTTLVAAPYC